jgi:hypothetical protein
VLTANGSVDVYNISLEQQPVRTFNVALPLTVSQDTLNGTTTPGAGNFTDSLAQHIYAFTIPTGGLNVSMNIGWNYYDRFDWKLLNSAGTTVTNGGSGIFRLGTLPADTYQLVLTANGSVDVYNISLEQQPVQTFNITLPLAVSKDTLNGTTTPGAGNFTDGLAQQVYAFTIPTGGLNVSMNIGWNYYDPFTWKLLNSAGETVSNGGSGQFSLNSLPAGNYQLVFTANGGVDPYTITLGS